MNPETRLMHTIMLALSEAGCIVWRNNTGLGYTGRVIHKQGDVVTLAGSRVIPFGLCVGSADLIGITKEGKFLAVEVKTKTGKPTKEQLNFIAAVNAAGGKAGIARSVEEALSII